MNREATASTVKRLNAKLARLETFLKQQKNKKPKSQYQRKYVVDPTGFIFLCVKLYGEAWPDFPP